VRTLEAYLHFDGNCREVLDSTVTHPGRDAERLPVDPG